ncbi:hypothetical protein A3742_08475 [Oleiphilus sp. HI0071]|uniref:response regulator n=1 Tax=unclassified Oleiphilus TaxID=2631174 RepID=UPI0007C242A7|nr:MULTISPECIES: response regulator [unclassified Oleiphilus]KZY72521.1 hypothetical protein A3737_10420 [Oleiphilus sp. HI0065]KZY82900.1 hypothetical protein A3742_08475 [Oleiphilus sp. HI0071]KZZ04789.1 hypothetical protein A3744_08895 [Oleiphilus sp. HI0073]KZZ49206.1 hypothetical protein A3760_03180 [Oleiphilus sp. HI0122]KZZ81053.1 hypothetical protein A3767_08385 [Oleiphilus sp. HI0133]
MSGKPLVMIVDDDEIARVIVREHLGDQYEIEDAESADACLNKLKSCTPDIFLLDVQMREKDGFALCEAVRHLPQFKATPVLFISAAETEENLIRSFEVGGNGFLEKPVKKTKLQTLIKIKLAQADELIETQKHREEAMTTSSELCQLIQFVKDSDDDTTLEAVAKRLCGVVESFGLSASAMIIAKTPIYVNCTEESPEGLLLKKAAAINERIISKGIRSIIRSDSVAILVNEMPVDDESRYGRFKDNLVVLSSICDGQLKQLMAQQGIEQQRNKVLSRVIKITEEQLQRFAEQLTAHEKTSTEVIGNMLTELETKLFHLGLDDDQEEELMKVAYQVHEKLEHMNSDYQSLEAELGKILESLYDLLASKDKAA